MHLQIVGRDTPTSRWIRAIDIPPAHFGSTLARVASRTGAVAERLSLPRCPSSSSESASGAPFRLPAHTPTPRQCIGPAS